MISAGKNKTGSVANPRPKIFLEVSGKQVTHGYGFEMKLRIEDKNTVDTYSIVDEEVKVYTSCRRTKPNGPDIDRCEGGSVLPDSKKEMLSSLRAEFPLVMAMPITRLRSILALEKSIVEIKTRQVLAGTEYVVKVTKGANVTNYSVAPNHFFVSGLECYQREIGDVCPSLVLKNVLVSPFRFAFNDLRGDLEVLVEKRKRASKGPEGLGGSLF